MPSLFLANWSLTPSEHHKYQGATQHSRFLIPFHSPTIAPSNGVAISFLLIWNNLFQFFKQNLAALPHAWLDPDLHNPHCLVPVIDWKLGVFSIEFGNASACLFRSRNTQLALPCSPLISWKLGVFSIEFGNASACLFRSRNTQLALPCSPLISWTPG